MAIAIRELKLPDDYEPLAELLNQHWAEPTSADRLREEDEKLYTTGHTWLDDNGMLAGYDRERRVAVTEEDEIVGYLWTWRAPWTEPGYLCNTLVVDNRYRKQGIGELMLRHIVEWAERIGAAALVAEVWDDQPESLQFVSSRGFVVERHAFQSMLRLTDSRADEAEVRPEETLHTQGLRLLTLADEPGEESERKLYELSTATMRDIPGMLGDIPDFDEWRKWYLNVDGFAPELVIIAADGDRFVGMTNVLHIAATNGMYHEYTCVDRAYRGKRIARALKLKAIELGRARAAAYIRTDNDSMNQPILHINQSLGYTPLRGSYRIIAPIATVAKELALRH